MIKARTVRFEDGSPVWGQAEIHPLETVLDLDDVTFVEYHESEADRCLAALRDMA